MFDTFTASRTGFLDNNEGGGGSGRFVEGDDASANSSFGAIASYQVCGCCARFHGVTDSGGGGVGAILNGDDRGGLPGDKPSLSTGDAGTQITRTNTSWSSGLGQAATVTFAFRASVTTMPTDTAGFSTFTAAQITATLQSLAAWSDVANITFVRVNDGGTQYSNNATMLFGNYSSGQSGAAAFAYLPGAMPGPTGASAVQGDVWINFSQSANIMPTLYSYGTQTLLHEIGHAIGLSHPAAYNASAGQNITYQDHAIYFEDSRQYTVMSYFSERMTGADFRIDFGTTNYASAPLIDDIAAAQRLYGANMTTRTGDTVYGFNSNAGHAWYSAADAYSPLVFAVWDAGGVDTFDFSGYTVAQTIDLRQGAFSNVGGMIGNVSIAVGAVIENVIGGTGADTIRGNSADNNIRGNGGADVIDGGLGTDTVVFSGARSAYTITWNGQIGTVTTAGQPAVTITNVEFLQFSDQRIAATPTGGLVVGGDMTNETIAGSALGDTLGGLGGDDVINGLAGDDYLDGGSGVDALNGGDGNDTLVGGLGNDTLDGGAGSDTADYAGAGTGVTVNLATGTSSGGAGVDTLISIENITGSTHRDTLAGDASANIIRGGGGADMISGGGGDDQLFAGAPGPSGGADDIIKTAETTNGTRQTAISLNGAFDLQPNHAILNATTIPHATVVANSHNGMEYYAITTTTSGQINIDIDGATFDSTLRLLDATGAELARNDDADVADLGSQTDSRLVFNLTTPGTYYIQVARWVSNSGSNFNSGSIGANQSYTLHVSMPGQAVQEIFTAGSTLNGDAGNDILTGGVGRDTLNGGADNDTLNGGAENDTLNGGDGIDTAVFSGNRSAYTFSTSNGVTTVSGPDGTDTLTNIERLQFANGLYNIAGEPIQAGGVVDGTPNADTLTGTTGDDTINGLGGDDVINGLAGNDTINGGDGLDTAVFSGTISQSTVSTSGGTTTVVGPDGTDTLTGIEYLRFSDGTLIVGAGGGQLFTGTPNADTITGTAFNDQINAGAGADIVNGADGNDIIAGGDGNDAIEGGAGTDWLYGEGGDDALTGGEGDDVLYGDRSRVAGGAAGSGNDTLRGGAGSDYLYGEAGNDFLDGGDGNDFLFGGDGDDTLIGGAGADIGQGGAGFDTLDYSGSNASAGGVTINYSTVPSGAQAGTIVLTGANGDAQGDNFTSIERLILTDFDDTVFGANIQTTEGILVYGGGGQDRLWGSQNADRFDGGDGDDFLHGMDGDDLLVGGAGNDELNGGAGIDTADYSSAAAGVTAQLNTGQASNDGDGGSDTLIGIENLTGSAFNDVLLGDAGANILRGGAGYDVLIGLDGDDVIYGGAGSANEMYGGAGNDRYIAEAEGDTVVEQAGEGIDLVETALARFRLSANVENLTYTGSAGFEGQGNDGANVIRGGLGRDVLIGFGGNDILYGGAGTANELYGGEGDDYYVVEANDTVVEGENAGVDTVEAHLDVFALRVNVENLIYGGTGDFTGMGNASDNVITGGAGNDILIGGAGNDTLNGGRGVDTADYSRAAAGVIARLDRNSAQNDGDGGQDVLNSIENLRGSAFNDVLYGDAGSNTLWGGAGYDVLIGFDGDDVIHGGTGAANEMYGGAGDDLYIVEAEGDTIVEHAGEGVDRVETALDRFRLSANVENLTYTGTGGFEGQGNAGDNVLRGGLGRDVLIGFDGNDIIYGGAGTANELYGGAGDDYYVLEAYDTVVEAENGGSDSIEARVNAYTLGANIENLVFGGTGNFVGAGNSLNNLIIGGAGDDVLSGGGGSDQIQGGAGYDRLLLRGVQADYTIVAEGSGWRIIDAVAGRDGSILATDMEVIEFGDRSNRALTNPVPAPAAEAGSIKAADAEPLVLPGADDPFVAKTTGDQPQVLPGADDAVTAKAGADQPQVLPGGFEDGFVDYKGLSDAPEVRPAGEDDLPGGAGGGDGSTFPGFGFGDDVGGRDFGGDFGGAGHETWGLSHDLQRLQDLLDARDPWG